MSNRLYPYTGEAFGLLPCAHCSEHLVEILSFSTRHSYHLTHPPGPCVLAGLTVLVSDRTEDMERMDAWNTRDGVKNPR